MSQSVCRRIVFRRWAILLVTIRDWPNNGKGVVVRRIFGRRF